MLAKIPFCTPMQYEFVELQIQKWIYERLISFNFDNISIFKRTKLYLLMSELIQRYSIEIICGK